MVSRETVTQAAFVLLAIVVIVAVDAIFPDLLSEPGGFGVGIVVFYAIALGGSHLVFYLSGDGDGLPRSARARFLAVLALVLPLVAAGEFLEGERLAGVDAPVLLAILAGIVLVSYFIIEMRHGYIDFAEEADLR